MSTADLGTAVTAAEILQQRHPILATEVSELDMFHTMIEVDSITGRVDTLTRCVQVSCQGGGQTIVMVLQIVELHHPGTELQQGGGLQLHVSEEPHDQGIVSQGEIFQGCKEHESMGQRGQFVLMKM